jgi:mRNA-degrading endonuclease RelE of RelBE toxin-antitoxin system
MGCSLRLTSRFDKNFRRLTKKDPVLRERVYRKIEDLLDNPEIGEKLSHNLAGLCSVHVGNWVVIYLVEGDELILLNFDHHDYAYFRPL